MERKNLRRSYARSRNRKLILTNKGSKSRFSIIKKNLVSIFKNPTYLTLALLLIISITFTALYIRNCSRLKELNKYEEMIEGEDDFSNYYSKDHEKKEDDVDNDDEKDVDLHEKEIKVLNYLISNPSFEPKGLPNYENNCYFNSSIQFFLNSEWNDLIYFHLISVFHYKKTHKIKIEKLKFVNVLKLAYEFKKFIENYVLILIQDKYEIQKFKKIFKWNYKNFIKTSRTRNDEKSTRGEGDPGDLEKSIFEIYDILIEDFYKFNKELFEIQPFPIESKSLFNYKVLKGEDIFLESFEEVIKNNSQNDKEVKDKEEIFHDVAKGYRYKLFTEKLIKEMITKNYFHISNFPSILSSSIMFVEDNKALKKILNFKLQVKSERRVDYEGNYCVTFDATYISMGAKYGGREDVNLEKCIHYISAIKKDGIWWELNDRAVTKLGKDFEKKGNMYPRRIFYTIKKSIGDC